MGFSVNRFKAAHCFRRNVIYTLIFFTMYTGPRSLSGQASSLPAESAGSERVPEYSTTKRITEKVHGSRLGQVLILPCEPREAGEPAGQHSSGVVARLESDVRMIPEGYFLSSHNVKIERQKDWLAVQPAKTEKMPAPPKLRLLPNARLEILEGVYTQKKDSIGYVVTGRVTEFEGVNYLLINNLMVASPRQAEVTTGKSAREDEKDKQAAGDDVSATRPSKERTPDAEDIADRLMNYKPMRVMEIPEVAPTPMPITSNTLDTSPPRGIKDEVGPLWNDDTMIVDRLGRLVRSDKWWLFVFEDQGLLPKLKPVRLLPNRLLEDALIRSGGGSESVVFIISGEATAYKGMNYLLLRKLLVRRDMGNLR